jgi:hypothetical protein
MATLYDSYWGSGNTSKGMDETTDRLGQTFTASDNYTTTTVDLLLYRQGACTTATLEIYLADGSNFPTGGVLATDTVDISGITTSSAGETVTFTLATELTNATKYVLVLKGAGLNFAVKLWIRGVTSGAYADGEYIFNPSGAGWQAGSGEDMRFRVYGDPVAGDPPTKAENPTPTNNDTEVDFSGLQLSWDDGGGADTFNVYIGTTGSLTLVSSAQAGTTYTTTLAELATVFGSDPIDQKIYWRIDSTNTDGTTTGDEWNFDARPDKAVTPTPTDTGSGQSLNLDLGWLDGAAEIADNYSVYFGLPGNLNLVSDSQSGLSWTVSKALIDYFGSYSWRIDSTNDFGTTTGTTWTFTTLLFDPPLPTGITLDSGTGNPTGSATGFNNMVTIRKVVALAENTFWYEEI